MSFPQGTTATLAGEYVDGSGSFTDPMTPRVSILNPVGTMLVADAVPTRDSLGHYSYDYDIAVDATLGTWIARWSGVIGGVAQTGDDEFEVVAGTGTGGPTADPYVSIDELRGMANLNDEVLFPDAKLQAARDWFESRFEEHVGMAFVPRTATERLDAGRSTIMLKHWPVRSITAVRSYTSTITYTEFTGAELADLRTEPTGAIRRYTGEYWPADIEVTYTHGQAAPPAEVKDIALVAIRQKLLADRSGDRGNRQLGVASEGVFVRNTSGPFFNDEVNDVANAYRAKYHLPGVA